MKQKRPVWVLGLDAGDHCLIERWTAEGALPAFGEVFCNGTYGILETTAETFSGSAWTSIVTACGPDQCGVYSRYQLVNGTYDVRRIRADDCKVNPFWSEFAGPTVVVDIPKAPLYRAFDGVAITEWGSYDHYGTFASAPGHIAKEVIRDFGRHPFIERDYEVRLHSRRDFDRIKIEVLEGICAKQRLNRALLRKYEPRFFFSVFGETHAAGHAFWRFQDPKHQGYDPNHPLQSALFEIYRAVDDALAETIEELSESAILLVLSSQGFSRDSMAGEAFLAEILVRLGLSVPRTERVNSAYAPYAPALALDMSRTQAFCLPTDLQGYIRINLRGREPHGVVAEDEYDAVCCKLETELLALRDPTYNTRLVKRILRVRELYPCDGAGALPDLVVIWNHDYVITGAQSENLGMVAQTSNFTGGGGNHSGPGFVAIYGRDIPQERLTGHVFDIAPTIAGFLGEANLEDRAGRVLPVAGLPSAES